MAEDHRTWTDEHGSSSDEHDADRERQQQLGPSTQLGELTGENEFLNGQLNSTSGEEHVRVETLTGEPGAGLSGTVSGSGTDSRSLVPANETQLQHESAQPAKPSLGVDSKMTDAQLSAQAVDDSRWAAPDTDQGLSSDDEPPAYVPRNFAAAVAASNKRESDASNHLIGDEMESAQISSLDDYIRMRRARPACSTEEGSKPPIRERSGFSNRSTQAESNSSSSKLKSIGRRVARLLPGPVSDTTRDVLDSFKQLIWEPPLIAPSKSSVFWEYYADAVYGIYPEGSRYERETSEANANESGLPSAVEERGAPASTMDDDLKAVSQKHGEQSARKRRRSCGLCYCCGFSLWTCTADPEIDRRRTAKLQSIANLLSPHQWLMNGVFSFLRGIIAAFVAGAILPVYLYLFAHVIDYWADIYFGLLEGNPEKSSHHYLIGFGVVTAAAVTSLFFQSRFLGALGRAARYRLRLWSFAALLQTIGVNTDRLDRYLFEQNTLEQMETLVIEAVEHFSASLTYAAQILACFIVGMTQSWFLTLVLLGVTPILAAVGLLQTVLTRVAFRRYEQAAQSTREFLNNTRAALPNIVLHDQFQKEFQKLYELTDAERKYDSRLNLLQSILRGLTFGFVLAIFAVLGIYLGGHLARTKHRPSGQLVAAILLSILLMASILKLTENLLRYFGSRRRLFVYLDFVLDLVDESQAGLGSVLRVDERSMSIIFREVSVIDDQSGWDSLGGAEVSHTVDDWRVRALASSQGRDPASLIDGNLDSGDIQGDQFTQTSPVFGAGRHGIGSRYAQYVFLNLSFVVDHHQTHCLIVRKRREERWLLELLSGKRRPDSGEILLGDHRLQDYTPAALTTAIGTVPWRGNRLIVGSTIFENIAFGSTGVSFTEVRNAASLVGVHEVILQLPNGYQTVVPPSNAAYSLFSPAQLQALSLARILLRNPGLLLIDTDTYVSLLEMTVGGLALDLKSICRGRTVVFVIRANFAESLYFADVISVIEDGRVVERGPHHELMARAHGIYAQLVRSNMAREADLGDLSISEGEMA